MFVINSYIRKFVENKFKKKIQSTDQESNKTEST